eukprot:CAMPEP_0170075472 /NCGR_PEP_ID=MMETSP0019_2-20121128/12601_1 /TAXON_ID=98059 /ORGANISM="Dinobryon sp., Strain UTEXLB2267" /LENGTH=334 /DNA_ID=CAMNT_0010286459 /DNA_START=282 /DNA_END=1286 /DNA_ORIENTATION=+
MVSILWTIASSILVTIPCLTASDVSSINFLAVGDWGGQDTKPYYTQGQKDSVVGMDKIATSINAEFVVALGDNFYNAGVSVETDPRFQQSFETVYTPASLQKNWYVIAGNHDHGGNVSAQIAYSQDSARWKFPSSFHSHSFTSGDSSVSVDIILIDTVDLAALGKVKDESASDYFDPLPELSREQAATQWDWIEAQMKASTADYLLVGGHYPVYSVCQHGPTATLITNLKPLLTTYQAHYMAGHDHCMEHIVEQGQKVNYFVTGMGEECCYSNSNLSKNPTGSVQWYIASNNAPKTVDAGFSSFTITKTSMTVSYYDQAGNVLYTTPAIAPRAL